MRGLVLSYQVSAKSYWKIWIRTKSEKWEVSLSTGVVWHDIDIDKMEGNELKDKNMA